MWGTAALIPTEPHDFLTLLDTHLYVNDISAVFKVDW